MKDNVYLLIKDPKNPCRDVIRSRDTSLKINVYCLDKENFIPDPDEIQLYGDDHGSPRAFETVGITADDALDVASAIRWYADYLDYPEMEILPENPTSPALGK
ncbi:hypothetical protein KXQ82_12125 [Mucilaginibacter sp. HMF5004]|uniref:hypothetical protein n=1 Tax=Mucilaginibacter rivuli TaxID=2857527 RepID=UPI001C5F0CA4|nr:hypothetical protein [Mucilaginibacter rivuli]MBW4890473.1 hypothetical protein [Mucilaginibacter rivuli]